jgi:hypothetical protein
MQFPFYKKKVKIVPVLKHQVVMLYGEEFTELNTSLTFTWDGAEWSVAFILDKWLGRN